MKIAFSFFLLIYSRCGAPASWAARHTIVCLDIELATMSQWSMYQCMCHLECGCYEQLFSKLSKKTSTAFIVKWHHVVMMYCETWICLFENLHFQSHYMYTVSMVYVVSVCFHKSACEHVSSHSRMV